MWSLGVAIRRLLTIIYMLLSALIALSITGPLDLAFSAIRFEYLCLRKLVVSERSRCQVCLIIILSCHSTYILPIWALSYIIGCYEPDQPKSNFNSYHQMHRRATAPVHVNESNGVTSTVVSWLNDSVAGFIYSLIFRVSTMKALDPDPIPSRPFMPRHRSGRCFSHRHCRRPHRERSKSQRVKQNSHSRTLWTEKQHSLRSRCSGLTQCPPPLTDPFSLSILCRILYGIFAADGFVGSCWNYTLSQTCGPWDPEGESKRDWAAWRSNGRCRSDPNMKSDPDSREERNAVRFRRCITSRLAWKARPSHRVVQISITCQVVASARAALINAFDACQAAHTRSRLFAEYKIFCQQTSKPPAAGAAAAFDNAPAPYVAPLSDLHNKAEAVGVEEKGHDLDRAMMVQVYFGVASLPPGFITCFMLPLALHLMNLLAHLITLPFTASNRTPSPQRSRVTSAPKAWQLKRPMTRQQATILLEIYEALSCQSSLPPLATAHHDDQQPPAHHQSNSHSRSRIKMFILHHVGKWLHRT